MKTALTASWETVCLGSRRRCLSVLIRGAATFGWLVLSSGPLDAAGPERNEPPFPRVLTHFEPVAEVPVFQGAGPGHWDARIRERGAIRLEDGQWKLWYTGYDGTRPGLKMLGLATSADGLQWIRETPHRPLYREHWVEDQTIVRYDGQYWMIAEGFLDRAQLLTSPDGRRWTRQGLLDIRQTNGTPIPLGPYGTPTLFVRGSDWFLMYERRDAGIWLAQSTTADRLRWQLVQDDPVLTPGPDPYDRKLIAVNQVFEHEGWWYAVFHGTAGDTTPARWASGIARSKDLRRWEKSSRNPLRPIEANVSSGQMFPLPDGRFRLYTVHDRVEVFESAR